MRLLNSDLTVEVVENSTLDFFEFDGVFNKPLLNEPVFPIRIDDINDGRIFSFVEQLRSSGYEGEIILSGVGADQAPMAFGVGVNSVVIPERQRSDDWIRAAGFVKAYYGARAPQQGAMNIIKTRHKERD